MQLDLPTYSEVPNKRGGPNNSVGGETFSDINKRVGPNNHVDGKLFQILINM